MRFINEPLKQIQKEMIEWVDHNFPGREPWEPLLGIQEEVGELSHSFLKRHQKIRTNEDHDAGIKDAVGDILIYLLDFCNGQGINAQDILTETWNSVKERDWQKYPSSGGFPPTDPPEEDEFPITDPLDVDDIISGAIFNKKYVPPIKDIKEDHPLSGKTIGNMTFATVKLKDCEPYKGVPDTKEEEDEDELPINELIKKYVSPPGIKDPIVIDEREPTEEEKLAGYNAIRYDWFRRNTPDWLKRKKEREAGKFPGLFTAKDRTPEAGPPTR